MKTLELNRYCEKLKIRPVNINGMSAPEKNFQRNDLQTFDIVRINKLLYMTFVDYDSLKFAYNERTANRLRYALKTEQTQRGLFMRATDWSMLTWVHINHYDNNLNRNIKNKHISHEDKWNISEIYVHGKDVESNVTKDFDDLLKIITQKVLEDIIQKYNYTKIER